MANCNTCGQKIGVFDTQHFDDERNIVCGECAEQLRLEKLKREQQEREARDKAIAKVVLTTGDIKEPYEILDTIIALEGHEAGYFETAKPSTAFNGVKKQLRATAFDMDANAVVHCQFEYRVAVGRSLFGSKQAIEIFAYGTAVKVKEKVTVE